MHAHLNIAIRAARTAGNIVLRYLDQRDPAALTDELRHDFVKLVQETADYEIEQTILKAYPDHQILGGETETPHSDYTWQFNSLNGYHNFIHNIPHFAVTITLKFRNNVEQSVIYNPITQELYSASKGRGAHLNDKRIRISARKNLNGALLNTCFPMENLQKFDSCSTIIRESYANNANVICSAPTALNLAYIAAGKVDGFWATDLHESDMAAGSLMVREAGGFIGDFTGNDNYLQTGECIAANPKIYGLLLRQIQSQ